jgi:hypothetical protein
MRDDCEDSLYVIGLCLGNQLGDTMLICDL